MLMMRIHEIKRESVTPLSEIVLTTLSNFPPDRTTLHITVCVSLGRYESNLSNHYMYCMRACFVGRNVREQKQTAHRLWQEAAGSASVFWQSMDTDGNVFLERETWEVGGIAQTMILGYVPGGHSFKTSSAREDYIYRNITYNVIIYAM